MINVSCLQNNIPLIDDLKEFVEYLGHKGIAEGKNFEEQKANVHLSKIFNQVRDAGVETDMQTLATIYKEVMPYNEYSGQFQSAAQVDRYAGKQYKKFVHLTAKLTPEKVHKQVGKESSELFTAERIMNAFINAHAPDKHTQSLIVDIQDMLWKALQRDLKPHLAATAPQVAKPKDARGWTDIVNEYLDKNGWGHKDVMGKANTVQDLYNKVRQVLNETKGKVADAVAKGNYDPATVQKFNDMVDALNASAMTMFFSKGDGKKLLYDMFKAAGYGKKHGNQEILNWAKLAGDHDSVADLRANVQTIMSKYRDPNGQGFRQDVIDSVKDSLEHEFGDLHKKQTDKQINDPETIGRQATTGMMESADVQAFLGGKTMKEWMETNQVQDLEDLEKLLNQKLAASKYINPVKREIRQRLTEFFEKNYPKVTTRKAQEAIEKLGIQAPTPRDNGQKAADWLKDKNITDRAGIDAAIKASPLNQLTAFDQRLVGDALEKALTDPDAQVSLADPKLRDAVRGLGLQAPAPPRPGITALAWLKKYGVDDVQKLETQLNAQLAGTSMSKQHRDEVEAAMKKILDLQNKAQKELKTREKTKERAAAKRKIQLRVSKNNIERLVELNNLGGFDGSHDRLVQDILGVDGLQKQDMDDVKAIMSGFGRLFREMESRYGSGASPFAVYPQQVLMDKLHSIFHRNQNNKAFTLKVINGLNNAKDLMQTGTISAAFSLMRNPLANHFEKLIEKISGPASVFNYLNGNKERNEVMAATLMDVATGGPNYGSGVSDFAAQTHFLKDKTLGWDDNKSDLVNLRDNIIGAVYVPAKIGLEAADSGLKVAISNVTFNNHIYMALTSPDGGGLSDHDAQNWMRESMYGRNWEQAKATAKEILEAVNDSIAEERLKMKITPEAITRFANDIVKLDLETNGAVGAPGVGKDMILACARSAYSVAGTGLGHEPNNSISRMIRLIRQEYNRKEKELVKRQEWDKLAALKFGRFVTEVLGFRFLGGSTNWLVLGAQKAGYPVITTTVAGQMRRIWGGKPNASRSKVNFGTPADAERTLKEFSKARNAQGRAIMGLGVTGILMLLGYMLAKEYGTPEGKIALSNADTARGKLDTLMQNPLLPNDQLMRMSMDAYQQNLDKQIDSLKIANVLMERIKSDPMSAKAFRTFSPDALLTWFYIDQAPDVLGGILNYGTNISGMKYTQVGEFLEAANQYKMGDHNGAAGTLGQIIGDRVSFPMWRQGKDYYQLMQYPFTGKYGQVYSQPQSFYEGLFGGGVMEDVFGHDNHNIFDPAITLVPGIGQSSYEAFKKAGISTMSDMKNNPNWPNMKDAKGQTILDPKARLKAWEFYNKYASQTWGDSTVQKTPPPMMDLKLR